MLRATVPESVHLSRRTRVERAFAELLEALGGSDGPEFARTPARATSLWLEHLLAGEGTDLATELGRGHRSDSAAPISVLDVGVHLVCAHHLTVAFGRAHVAYAPQGRVVGFAALARLIRACTARFVLHEEASQNIATALVTHLPAAAAVACIEAVHPCHNVMQPRSHGARAIGWAQAGRPGPARQLRQLLAAARRP